MTGRISAGAIGHGDSAQPNLKKKKENKYECILLCGQPCSADNSLYNITADKWKSMQEKVLKWMGIDTFGNVYTYVDWKRGPKGSHMHDSCYTSLSSKCKLSLAEKRKIKSQQSLQECAEV